MNAINNFVQHHSSFCEGNGSKYVPCTCKRNEAIVELIKLQNEHGFMSEQIDKLNTEMPCGHLTRYQVEEKDTQYCSLCRIRDDREYIDYLKGFVDEENQ